MDEAARNVPVVSTDAARMDLATIAQSEPSDPARCIEQQVFRSAFENLETVDLGEQRRHRPAVELAVGLRSRTADRRPLAAVHMRN